MNGKQILTIAVVAVIFFGTGFGTAYYLYVINVPPETIYIRIISCSGSTIWRDAQGNAITRAQQMESLAAEYMDAHPNVEITVDGVGWTAYHDKLIVTCSAGNPYDLMEFAPGWLDDFARNGWLYDLDEFVQQGMDDFYEGALMNGRDSLTGVQYFIPYGPDTYFFLYNKGIFADAGVEPPTSWDEFLEIAPLLTQDTNGDGVTDIYAWAHVGNPDVTSYLGYDEFLFHVMEFADPDKDPNEYLYNFETNRYCFNGPEGVEAATFMKQVYDAGYVPDVLSLGTEDHRLMFTAERVAMYKAAPFHYNLIADDNPDLYANRLGAFPLIPGHEGGQAWNSITGWGFAVTDPDIYVGSEPADREVVLDFLAYILEAENMIKFLKRWPARENCVPLLEAAGQWAGAPDEDIAIEALNLPNKPRTPRLGTDIDDVLYEMMVKILKYDADIQETLDWAVVECNGLLQEAGY